MNDGIQVDDVETNMVAQALLRCIEEDPNTPD